jgi:hypothetical protein
MEYSRKILKFEKLKSYHSSSRVENFHLGENCGAIVGNDNSSLGILDLNRWKKKKC